MGSWWTITDYIENGRGVVDPRPELQNHRNVKLGLEIRGRGSTLDPNPARRHGNRNNGLYGPPHPLSLNFPLSLPFPFHQPNLIKRPIVLILGSLRYSSYKLHMQDVERTTKKKGSSSTSSKSGSEERSNDGSKGNSSESSSTSDETADTLANLNQGTSASYVSLG